MAATGTLDTNTITAKVQEGDRISAEDALFLFQHASPLELSALATLRREQSAPGRTISYIVGRILNYTNVCWVRCKFCAFHRVPNHPEGYVLSDDDILEKVGHTVATAYELDRHLGVPEGTDRAESVEILFQGGLNPKLKLDYYEGIFRKIKERFPEVILHAL